MQRLLRPAATAASRSLCCRHLAWLALAALHIQCGEQQPFQGPFEVWATFVPLG
jgi:hypothetical protein